MQDILTMLNAVRRPELMMRAARIGAQSYRQTAHLPRLLGYGVLPRHAPAVLRLMEMEAALEDMRTRDDASYSVVRHLDVLIALVGEARVLSTAQASTAIT
jgi:hypothetical protein